jgi:hypothetical protein
MQALRLKKSRSRSKLNNACVLRGKYQSDRFSKKKSRRAAFF